jgi:hypothetical protein
MRVRSPGRGAGAWLAIAAVLTVLAGPVAAQRATPPATGTPPGRTFSTDEEITPEMEAAVTRALQWLAARANRDGSFGPPKARIAVTAIAALSFMAGGSTADRGPYQRAVNRAVKYLVDHVSRDPRHHGYIYLPEDADSRMHGHGYATLALAEALGTYGAGDPDRSLELKRAVEAAVRLIERTQSDAGGWYYHPENDGNHEGSITVCMLQALRAAHNAGIAVKKRVIDRAIRYIERSAERRNGLLTGAFRYSLVDQTTSFSLTAAAVSTLQMCGQYESELIQLGLSHMGRELDQHLAQGQFYYYGLLYASQAYFQVGGRHWRLNFPRIRDSLMRHLVDRDDPEPGDAGAFDVHGPSEERDYGRVYATAMATLTLQIPYRFLPIFQK